MDALAAFSPTHRLLPLINTDGGRIVYVASLGQSPIQFGDLALARSSDGWLPYNQSKLAMIIRAPTCRRRWHALGILPMHTVASGVEARAHVAEAYDPAVRERLWRVSLELTGAPSRRDRPQAAISVPPV